MTESDSLYRHPDIEPLTPDIAGSLAIPETAQGLEVVMDILSGTSIEDKLRAENIVLRYFVDGETYANIAPDYNITPSRAQQVSKRVVEVLEAFALEKRLIID